MGQEITSKPAATPAAAPSAEETAMAKQDFSALAVKYKAMQQQAYTTQDVLSETVAALKTQLDTYIAAHVDVSTQTDVAGSADKTLESMETMTTAQQARQELNNAGWDSARETMEALLNEIAPAGAEAIYSPVAAASGPEAADDVDIDRAGEVIEGDVSGEEEVEEAAGGTAPAADLKPAGGTADAGTGAVGDQSGAGWGGADILDPKTSATYKGLSLDALLAKPDSLVAKQIGNQPDVVAAIRKVSAETGVPSGLMAAMVIQESNGNRKDVSGENSGYGNSVPLEQRRDAGLIQSPLWKFDGANTAEKLKNSEDPYTNLRMFADEAKSTYADTGSWGQVANVWYTGDVADRLDGEAAGGSKEENYVKNVFANLGMGGSSYYAGG